MPKANGDWTDLEEKVALALINQSGESAQDPGYHFDTVADIPYPRLRSEMPYAIAAVETVLEAAAVEAESPVFVGDDGDEVQLMFDFVNRKWFTVPDFIRSLKEGDTHG